MVLVTGAAGFFGIHVVKVLLERGHEVVGLGTSSFPEAVHDYLEPEERARLSFVVCDISDQQAVAKVLRDYPVDVVIHGAVMTILGECEVGRERRMTEVNAVGTLNLLEEARRRNVERFVYISSSGVYGSHGMAIAPVHELVTVYPGEGSVYVTCKIYSELMCQHFGEHGAFSVAIARIGSPYGPWERPTGSRKGMSPIYHLVKLAMEGRDVNVFGRDEVRDWTHMRDIAEGTALLAMCDEGCLQHTVYNVSSGVLVSIERILQCLQELIPGFSYRFVAEPGEANVIARTTNQRGPLDISRLREDCGFKPRYPIDEGLTDYVCWWGQFASRAG